MNKIRRIIFPVIILVMASIVEGWGQCAMCRASVENNISEGSAGLSAGLNTGIMYLFIAPYLLVAIIGFLWYKKSKLHARKVQTSGHFRS